MTGDSTFILGEYHRLLDERYRVSIPTALVQALGSVELLLVKERPGALSLWNAPRWEPPSHQDLQLIASKMQAGRLVDRVGDVQRWGRLLSTRQRTIQLAQRGRLLIPEGFREFLGVEPGGGLMVVGAALCVEIWHPESWREHLSAEIARFRDLEESLSK